MSEELERLKKRLERERKARTQAEQLLEAKSLELYKSNLALQDLTHNLEKEVESRVSDLQIALAELKLAKEQAENSNRAKSSFLANMSHEIRTPMNGIIGMCELLIGTALNNTQKHYAETIERSAGNLLRIINDILDISKLEAGKMELLPEVFNLDELIQEVATLLTPVCHSKGIELLLWYQPDLPLSFYGDTSRLRQILLNLLGNAVKFTEEGHVLLGVKAGPVDGEIEIFVQDTGIGISTEAQTRLFQNFVQVDQSSSKKFEGTGLGLSLCRSLTKLMGGKITVLSREGLGSTFSVLLPLPARESSTRKDNESASELLKSLKVLVVDPNLASRLGLVEWLVHWNVQVEQSNRAEDAVAMLDAAQARSSPFDLVLSDAQLPEVSGSELAHMLKRELQDHAPAMVLMGSRVEDFEHCPPNAIDFLYKPIGMSKLKSELLKFAQLRANAKSLGDLQQAMRKDDQSQNEPNKKKVLFNEASVLVVEDNPTNRELISIVLKSLGCSLTFAHDGLQAVEKFCASKAHGFDFIFMDCQMPLMDGFEATRQIRAYEQKHTLRPVPIVAMTANALVGDREKCLEAGMTDYLSKPARRQQIIAILAQYMPNKVVHKIQVDEPVKKADQSDLLLIDLAHLFEMVGESAEVARSVLQRYRSILLTEKAVLQNVFSARSASELAAQLHKMKGGARASGAMLLASKIEAFEAAVKRSDEGAWDRLYHLAIKALEETVSALEAEALETLLRESV